MKSVTKKGKSNSWLSLISFSVFKVRKSVAVWVLFILSLTLFGAVAIALFLSSKDVYEFFKNFQYGVFIFNNILLLLFILLIIIKIFGREFEDGTYLLLISKPYSRFTLFLLKLIAIWILIVFFLGLIIIFALGMGYLANVINANPDILKIYKNLLLKLFLYSMMLSFLASSGIIFATTFLNSQVVLLIVVIFCSLFLIGGMPYSLIMTLGNAVELTINNVTQPYPVNIIKSTLEFKDNLQKDLIKYPNLTKKIYDFYSTWTYSDLDKVFKVEDYSNINDSASLRIKRLSFYKSLGLTVNKSDSFTINTLKTWDQDTTFTYDGAAKTIKSIITTVSGDLSMEIYFESPYFFKSLNQLNQSDPVQKDLYDYIKVIQSTTSQTSYALLNSYEAPSLMYVDPDSSYYLVTGDSKLGTDKHFFSQSTVFNPWDLFKEQFLAEYGGTGNSPNYENGSDFREWVIDYFSSQPQFVLREIEIDVLKKIMDEKLFQSNTVAINSSWVKYDSLMNTYSLIAKFNIIEHWNQIWTASLNYSPYWFNPLERSNIDFSVQNNYLMSYQDFRLTLNQDGKLNLNPSPILNIDLILYIYLGVSGFFLICSYLILRRKNIT